MLNRQNVIANTNPRLFNSRKNIALPVCWTKSRGSKIFRMGVLFLYNLCDLDPSFTADSQSFYNQFPYLAVFFRHYLFVMLPGSVYTYDFTPPPGMTYFVISSMWFDIEISWQGVKTFLIVHLLISRNPYILFSGYIFFNRAFSCANSFILLSSCSLGLPFQIDKWSSTNRMK